MAMKSCCVVTVYCNTKNIYCLAAEISQVRSIIVTTNFIILIFTFKRIDILTKGERNFFLWLKILFLVFGIPPLNCIPVECKSLPNFCLEVNFVWWNNGIVNSFSSWNSLSLWNSFLLKVDKYLGYPFLESKFRLMK